LQAALSKDLVTLIKPDMTDRQMIRVSRILSGISEQERSGGRTAGIGRTFSGKMKLCPFIVELSLKTCYTVKEKGEFCRI
jgi:hypothetical protein